MSENEARRAAEATARHSYGRLVAILSSRTRDVAAAEDALADAFAAALRVWPERGVPDRPEAWLVTAARRTLGHGHRAEGVRARARPEIERTMAEVAEMAASDPDALPDRRLGLLFACAHPAIDPASRAPLMLQCVLGLDAVRIATAFLVSEAAMAKRLVRAKAKIHDAGIGLAVPPAEGLAPRLGDVLSAIYAAYRTGWDLQQDVRAGEEDLAGEAIFLAQLVVALLPAEPEASGLLALLLYCEARRAARRGPDGAFVPLAEQDTRLWSREMILEAEGLLTAAARERRFGRFQCEAAIQSVHALRLLTRRTDWAAIVRLYDLLIVQGGTTGAEVARAAALLSAGDPRAAAERLQAIDAVSVADYQPYWATVAEVAAANDDLAAAEAAFARAAALAPDAAVRDHLAARSRMVMAAE